jgi:hypothetical protein
MSMRDEFGAVERGAEARPTLILGVLLLLSGP